MKVRDVYVPVKVQYMILSNAELGISKFTTMTHVCNWLDCSYIQALKVVNSVLGVCLEPSEIET